MQIKKQSHPFFLSDDSEISRHVREINWLENPLGPMEGWSPALQSALSICLNSNFPIAIYWGEELILLYNEAWSSIPGNKHPWAIGRPAKEVWPDIWEAIEPQFAKALSGTPGGSKDALLPMQRHGYTEECYFDFTFTPVFGTEGKVEGVFNAVLETTYQIITKRRSDFLRRLAMDLMDGLSLEAMYAHTIRAISQNPQDIPFALIYSLTDEAKLEASTIGDNLDELLKKPWPFATLLQGNTEHITDLSAYLSTIPHGPWPEAPHEALIVPLHNSEGILYACLIAGISARRAFDDEYQNFLESVGRTLSGALNTLSFLQQQKKRADELAEIDRAKTVFFSNISHEFRTPLTLMLGPIEDALQDDTTLPHNRTRMDVAMRNGLRLQKLVNTLLEFSRIEAGRADGSFTKVDIGQLTAELASSFRSAIEKAGMQLIVHTEQISSDVYVDIEMWEKIILNLISNAFKYSNDGTIEVTVKQHDDKIIVSVTDTGIGIAADHLDKIFDRFHRIENSGGRSLEGTGIGLALVKELVNLHGGYITVVSEERKGSTFTVTIPAGNNHLQQDRISKATNTRNSLLETYTAEAEKWVSEPSEDVQFDTANSAGKPVVLLADDNADMRDYISRLLLPSFQVITVTDGEEALQRAVDIHPDLVLSDIMMPKLDGFGLLQGLRDNPSTNNIPLIFLSARAGEDARIEGLDKGADDYLVKPFTAKELLAKIDSTIKIAEARRKAQTYTETLFMQAPAAIAVLDGPELRFTLANALYLEVFGRRGKSPIGKTVREVFPEIEGQGIYELLEGAFQTGKPFVASAYEAEIEKEGSHEKYIGYYNFVAQPIKNEGGKVESLLIHAVEVTEQIEASKKLEDNSHQLSDALGMLQYRKALLEAHNQTSLDGILLVERSGKILSYNQRFVNIWNMPTHIIEAQSDEAALQFAMTQLVHPQEFMRNVQSLYETRSEVKTDELEFTDGKIIQRQGYPVIGEDGTYYAWSWTFRDITEYKRAEQALRDSEAYFRTLTDAMPQIVWTANADGATDYFNERWYEYTGMEKGYGDTSWLPILHPDDVQTCIDTWYHSVITGVPYQIEYRFADRTNGGYRWFLGKALPVRNSDGVITKWFGSCTDIDDQKRFSEKLELLVAERTIELQRSNEDLQRFAHVASHDLKEPVRKMTIFSDMLGKELSGNTTEKGMMFLEKIQSASSRMTDMIEGVLKFSKISGSQQRCEQIDLNKVIADVMVDLEVPIQQTNANIQFQNLPTIEGATVLIHQLFYNLINNALKFSKKDAAPQVEISATVRDDGHEPYALIAVSDNGIGFNQQHAEHIFDTFTRLHPKDKYEGTGLGLALCKRIAVRHGGDITADGSESNGATFYISLPIHQQTEYI